MQSHLFKLGVRLRVQIESAGDERAHDGAGRQPRHAFRAARQLQQHARAARTQETTAALQSQNIQIHITFRFFK